MKKQNKIKSILIDIIAFISGGVLYSIAVNCFLAENNILGGGFTGLATVINYLFDLPIGSVIILLNIPLFLAAFKKLGIKFVLSSFLATFIFSVFIDLGERLPVYGRDMLLSSIFGGVLSGIGLGIILTRGATTGGTDIIAKLVSLKYPNISLGKTIFAVDLLIIAISCVVYGSIEASLYSAIAVFVSAETLDYIIFGIHRTGLIIVVTEKGDEIRRLITNDIHRGVTLINGRGGYTDTKKDVLICACYDSQTGTFIRKIKALDEKAFLIITPAKEILGEGFR